MWTITLRTGELYSQHDISWSEAKTLDVANIKCSFYGKDISLPIPIGCTPLLSDILRCDVNVTFKDNSKTIKHNSPICIAKIIGYKDKNTKHLVRINKDGSVQRYTQEI